MGGGLRTHPAWTVPLPVGTAAPHPGQADLQRALRRGGAAAHAAGPQPVQLLTGGDRGHYLKRTKSSEIDLENGMIPITPYVGYQQRRSC